MFNRDEKKTIFEKINFKILIDRLLEKESRCKLYPSAPISEENFLSAKYIIQIYYLEDLRADNFCIDLTDAALEIWTKEQSRAFAKLFIAFSNELECQLKIKQEQKLDIKEEVQLLWIKFPTKNDENKKIINSINKSILNHGYEDHTGNDGRITLLKNINSQRANPIAPFSRTNKSISLVIVTDSRKVLLLKRGGLSGRAGTWGTLTGTIENSSKEKTLIREVHEEINLLVANRSVHYVGSFHTDNMSKDLVEKGRSVTYADDCCHVYGMIIPEEELVKSIKLDGENSSWRLFTKEELNAELKLPGSGGEKEVKKDELHVALAKTLLVLETAKNNFANVEQKRFNYPYTNSPGFFVHIKANQDVDGSAVEQHKAPSLLGKN